MTNRFKLGNTLCFTIPTHSQTCLPPRHQSPPSLLTRPAPKHASPAAPGAPPCRLVSSRPPTPPQICPLCLESRVPCRSPRPSARPAKQPATTRRPGSGRRQPSALPNARSTSTSHPPHAAPSPAPTPTVCCA